MPIDVTNWRTKELSLDQVAEKYPDIPYLVLLKIDVHRRGLVYSKKALKAVDSSIHLLQAVNINTDEKLSAPLGLLLRDGSSIVRTHLKTYPFHREPYTVDYIDGKFVLTDEGKILEEVFPWEKPDFWDKKTSRGTPMNQVAMVRSQRFEVHPNLVCHFWDNPHDGCKYCNLFSVHKKDAGNGYPPEFWEDIKETAAEAFKQPGRYANVHMTAGSLITGKETFDDELEIYIKAIQAVGSALEKQWIPMQIVASPFNDRQLKRLKNETGITSFDSDIEVLNPKVFEWICPGKAKLLGHEEWKNRIIHAVEVFGRGRVNTGVVVGVELAEPHGFTSEDEAFEDTMKRAEEFTKNGVALTVNIWTPCVGSILFKQNNPSLDYYVRVIRGFHELHKEYHLSIIPDDWRRCGQHPNLDLDRLIDFDD